VRSSDLNFNAPEPYTTNASELASNYFISYSQDATDLNTYDDYEGTSAQMILTPIAISDKKNLLLKNLTEKRFRFALAKRKEELTLPERVIQPAYDLMAVIFGDIAKSIDTINNTLGKSESAGLPNIPSFFETRIGMMLLSTDFIGVPKFFIWNPSTRRIHKDNKVTTSAANMMAKFHSADFPIKGTGTIVFPHKIKSSDTLIKKQITFTKKGNQWLIYKNKTVPLCCENFLKHMENNFAKTEDGKDIKLLSEKWNPFDEKAVIDYATRVQYITNLKETYIIDGRAA
jgi:hypothetical protein